MDFELKPPHEYSLWVAASQAAEKVVFLSFRAKRGISPGSKINRMRDSSARSVPRNDKRLCFSATSSAPTLKQQQKLGFSPCRLIVFRRDFYIGYPFLDG